MDGQHPSEEEIRARYSDVLEMVWVLDGKELLLLRGDRDQSYLERHSWPDEGPIVTCESNQWETALGLIAPPRAPYAAVPCAEQGESGFVIVNLRTMKSVAVYSSGEMIAGAAFSPDDRLFVALYQLEPEPEEVPSSTPAIVTVGNLVIGLVGEWDFLEVPFTISIPPELTYVELEWPPLDDLYRLQFADDRHVSIPDPRGRMVTVDIERLRTDLHWLELRTRKRQQEKEEREYQKALSDSIREYNARALDLSVKLSSEGLTCPACGRHGRDIRFHPGSSERALFICPGCGRSFGPDSFKG